MFSTALSESIKALSYRLATFMVNHVIDDPAILGIIFC